MLHARGLIWLQLAPARLAHSARATKSYTKSSADSAAGSGTQPGRGMRGALVVALELTHPDDPSLPALGDHAKAARTVEALARLEHARRTGPTLEEGGDKDGAPVLAKL
eukprot:5916197-Prymnesium_polylepis.1